MDSFFEEKLTLGERLKRHQVGIYATILVHLLIIGVLLVYQIADVRREKMSILIDFSNSKEERLMKEQKLLEQKEKIKQEVDKMYRDARAGRIIRNVAVNTADTKTSTLKDDKGINESVYEEAQELQAKINSSHELAREIMIKENNNNVPVVKKATEASGGSKKESYNGPSVISYTLDGRRALYLPVPVYKCPGGGDVTVTIEVKQNGQVSGVSVASESSGVDDCLKDAAKRAARLSRFTADNSAPVKQTGTIVYRFIPQ